MLNKENIEYHESIIIGAGFSGIGLAIKLKQQELEFLVLEGSNQLGGVWRDNTYPAAACDVPSRLYSYSFAQNTTWGRSFSCQQEILNYLKNCVIQNQLSDKIQFNQCVTSAQFDEISGHWLIQTASGETFSARFLITACGQLCQPATPEISGLKQFEGTQFHSARWLHDHDLTGEKVAVIGTGASAIQFIPEIAKVTDEIIIFQRTPPYVLPKRDRTIRSFEKSLMTQFPLLQNLIRKVVYIKNEFRALYMGPLKGVLKLYALRWRWFMHSQIKNNNKRKQLTPNYVIGCKRILISNNYYSTLNQQHIKLESNNIEQITKNGVQTSDGKQHSIDTIILATGFKTSDFLNNMKIIGLAGISLHEKWQDGAFAYHGLTIKDFPNLLMCYGPNTNIGHNSMIHILESQFNYICDFILKSKTLNIKYLNLKDKANNQYQKTLQKKLNGTVWQQGGCHSWYQTKSGKNTNNWPGLTLTYRLKTRSVDLTDYVVTFCSDKLDNRHKK